MVKATFAKTLDKARQGLRRFAPFHVCAAAFAVLHWLAVYDCVDDAVALNVMRGVCWGALAGAFVQLVGESRGRPPRTWLVSAATACVAALGCWFWFRIGDDSPRYWLWTMLYGGSTVSLSALSMVALYRVADEKSLVSRLALNAFCVAGSAGVFVASECLCLAAFDKLVAHVDWKLIAAVSGSSWLALVPIGFMALLPGKEDDGGASDRASAFLFWLLLPASLAMLLILYVYLGKIVVTWSMPSGELNWFGSVAIAVYVFFWLALRDSERRFFRLFVRWGWALLLPVLAAQIAGIAIRYNAYGLSTPRFAGMVTLSFGVAVLALAALNRRPRGLFVFIAVAGLVFTVSPFNVVDVPVRNQEARLRAALARNGLLRGDELAPNPKKAIPDADARIIVGAWEYLTEERGGSRLAHSKRADFRRGPVRPTVWHRPSFTEGLIGCVDAESNPPSTHTLTEGVLKNAGVACGARGNGRGSLFALLNIDRSRIAADGKALPRPRTETVSIVCGDVPLAGHTHVRTIADWNASCALKAGEWVVSLPATDGVRIVAWDKFTVTEHVRRALADAGCDGTITEKMATGDRRFALKPEHALWELRPGMALVVGEISLHGEVGKKIKRFNLRCAVAAKREDGK